MEISDADGVGRSSHQLFLAASIRCELGSWTFLPRAARHPGMGLSAPLLDRGTAASLFPDASFSGLDDATLEAARRANLVVPASCRLSRGRLALGASERVGSAPFLALLAGLARLFPHRRLRLRILDRSFKRRNIFFVEVREGQ